MAGKYFPCKPAEADSLHKQHYIKPAGIQRRHIGENSIICVFNTFIPGFYIDLYYPFTLKDVIIDSLKFLVKEKRVQVNTFVIMSNHIHLIWQVQKGFVRKNVQRDFLKFTSQTIKRDLKKNHPAVLEKFLVNAKDRKYQIWERNPLSLDLLTKRYLFKR
jgi:hypothetical protein